MSKFLNQGMYSSASCEWETQQELFDRLNDEFHFTMDPCCTEQNAKRTKHYILMRKKYDGRNVIHE